MITIVDYGMGNMGSVQNMFKRLGVQSCIESDPQQIEKAEKILLPGVGAFDAAMKKINDGGFREVLSQKALKEKVPLLGICLGMQLLTNSSEEGTLPGLRWIPAKTLKFRFSSGQPLKVPHMGWNSLHKKKDSQLIEGLSPDWRFYFLHSYYVKCDDVTNILTATDYGLEFDSIIQKDNIYGAQFHPEKSHKFGMALLENFAKL